MISLVDSHCHLDFERFDQDREGVIAAAESAGVRAIVNPGVDLATSEAAIRLAEQFDLIYAAVGVHPNDASDLDGAGIERLRHLAAHPKVVAIGEIGLDYYRDYTPHDVQRNVFWRQLELAADLGLPIIVHNRDASVDTMSILAEWVDDHPERCGVLHSYSAGPEWLDKTVELGLSVGISGPVTFSKSVDLQQVARIVPLERLLLETDAPFLTPEPYRGRRNEPAYVRYVAETIAHLRGLDPQVLGEQTTRNVIKLFNIGNTVE